jgi:hypothetical protein
MVDDDEDKAGLLNEYFSSVFTKEGVNMVPYVKIMEDHNMLTDKYYN